MKKARIYGNVWKTRQEVKEVLNSLYSHEKRDWKLHAGKDNFWWVQWEKESDYDTFPVGKWYRVDRQIEK